METGLSVHLDPHGGNQLNIRAMLHACGIRTQSADEGELQTGDADEDAGEGGEDEEEEDLLAPNQNGSTNNNNKGSSGRVSRRVMHDDYDYNDDFIDDDELIEVEEDDDIVMGSPIRDHNFNDSQLGFKAALSTHPSAAAAAAAAAMDVEVPATVTKVDSAFYVNRGDIRPRAAAARLLAAEKKRRPLKVNSSDITEPAAGSVSLPRDTDDKTVRQGASGNAKTAVVVSNGASGSAAAAAAVSSAVAKGSSSSAGKLNLKVTAQGTLQGTKTGGAAGKTRLTVPKTTASATTMAPGDGAKGANAGVVSGSSTKKASGKGSGGESDTGGTAECGVAKRRRSEEGGGSGGGSSSGKVTKKLHAEVQAVVDSLQSLCTELFGEKKPRLNEPEVHARILAVMQTGIQHGVARLHSDVAKDNRRVALNDELWSALNKFLRTTRSNIETLGHALHWSEEEKRAQIALEEEELVLGVRVRNMVGNNQGFVKWNEDIDEVVYQWYKARCTLQEAKNQLASRPRTAKKAAASWVQTLRKAQFSSFGTEVKNSDIEFIESFKRVEEKKTAAEKKRREQEREARKRKRDENAGNLPKKISDSLPPGLRKLASLKARPETQMKFAHDINNSASVPVPNHAPLATGAFVMPPVVALKTTPVKIAPRPNMTLLHTQSAVPVLPPPPPPAAVTWKTDAGASNNKSSPPESDAGAGNGSGDAAKRCAATPATESFEVIEID